MTTLRAICVYCGSSPGVNPAFEAAARRLGADMARAGVRLVYGGGDVGLMGAVARSVLDHGGGVTGIIPKFLQRRERMLADVEDLIVTTDMHERKRLMFERADAFVALPGGVGTLEELVEQLTWAQLGQHRKPILVADIDGFWSRLVDLLDHMREAGFIARDRQVDYLVARRAEDIVPAIQQALAAQHRHDLSLKVGAELL